MAGSCEALSVALIRPIAICAAVLYPAVESNGSRRYRLSHHKLTDGFGRGAMAGEVIQRGIEAQRPLRPARTLVRVLPILFLADANVALDRAAQDNGQSPRTTGPVAVPIAPGGKVDARYAE